MEFTTIEWETYGSASGLPEREVVPIDQSWTFGDTRNAWPKRAFRTDGTWTFAKGWRSHRTGQMCRIGLGADGSATLMHRDV